jgi:hypothetical protein
MYFLSDFEELNNNAEFKGDSVYGVWWTNRSTSTAVSASSSAEAIAKARKKKKKGYGQVKGAKKYDKADAAKARKGKWVTTRYDSSPSSQKSKYRPQLAKIQKNKKKSY